MKGYSGIPLTELSDLPDLAELLIMRNSSVKIK